MAADFTIGIEEEYLLVDQDSFDLREAPDELMSRCETALGGQFSPEYLACQVEIGSKVCTHIDEARHDLKHLRATVATLASEYNLAPIAASCHPFADWKDQKHTNKDRYHNLTGDLAGVVRRMLICGMHVHVGLEQKNLRIDILNQMAYFLPHILALSTSSPFWQGQDTGLSSYRLSVFDNLPRTGLPPQFDSWGEYERSVHVMIDLGVIEDTSKIWWDLRPSAQFPTLETRICDVQPRLEDTLSLAALIQCLTRMLTRLRSSNQRWRIYDNFLLSENRWRAQRYGATEGLIDFGAGKIVDFSILVEELITLIMPDAEALNCVVEIENLRQVLHKGTSASRQRTVYQNAIIAGDDTETANRAIVAHLIEEYHADL
ncbi:MAG: carboxylate-amine ligase [Halocynthiibacter sp.]